MDDKNLSWNFTHDNIVENNPFSILEVTPNDTIEIINEASEDKAFADEENERFYENARQVLINPIKRLHAEVRWFFDGELNAKARTMVGNEFSLDYLDVYPYMRDEFHYVGEEKMLYNPRENLVASIVKLPSAPREFIANYIIEMDRNYAEACENDQIYDLIDDINIARRKAKLPLCKDSNAVKNEVKSLINDVENVLNQLFNEEDEEFILEFTNEVAAKTIEKGYKYGRVIEKLIDLYQGNFHELLTTYKDKITDEIEVCKENYSEEHELDELCNLVRRFDYIAQPIQLLLKDRGQAELQEQSVDVANEVRELALYYNNEEERPKLSVKLLNLEMELFSELPEFYSSIAKDKKVLGELVEESNFTSRIDSKFDELEENIVHDNESMQRNQVFLKSSYSVINNLIEEFANYVKNRPGSDNNRYKYESTMVAIYYRSLGVNCTWADMWDEASDCYKKSLYWANQTNNQDLINKIESGLDNVQRNLIQHKRHVEESVLTDKLDFIFGELEGVVYHDNKLIQSNKKHFQPLYYDIKKLISDFTSFIIKNPCSDDEQHKYEFAMAAMYYRTLGVNCTWADMWNEASECYNSSLYWANLTNDQDLINRVKKDLNDVQRAILQEKKQAEREAAEKIAINYENEWGLVFKNRVKLSQYGLEYNSKSIPLAEISKVSWGMIKKQTKQGSIPLGTDYCINVGSDKRTIYIETNKQIYLDLTDRLWKAVAPQIIKNVLTALKNGQDAGFGEELKDSGIHYKEKKWFSKDIDIFYTWNEIRISHGNGTLDFINWKNEVLASYSYISTYNVHILEVIVDLAKRKGLKRLSDLL